MVVCQRQTRRIAPVVATSIVGLALMTASVLIASSRQEERHISVNDARPLAAAVKQLEADLGQVITYEDPPYLYPEDYVDLTSAVSGVGFDLLTVGNAFHVVLVAARDRAGVTHAHHTCRYCSAQPLG